MSDWRIIDAEGDRTLPQVCRRQRVLKLWRDGMDSWSIGQALDIDEAQVCRILRDARDVRRQPAMRPRP